MLKYIILCFCIIIILGTGYRNKKILETLKDPARVWNARKIY